MTPLVIGVGNPWRGDDGAGIELARRVGGVVHEGECTRLLDRWSPDDDVLIVDAARAGDPPGTLHRFDATREPLPAAVLASSTHAVGVPEGIELARALGRMPRRLRVIGIEGEDFAAGAALSSSVEGAVSALVEELRT